LSVGRWQSIAGGSAGGADGLAQIAEFVSADVVAGSALCPHQVCTDENMRRRVIAPVGEQLICLPQGQAIDFFKRPSGSGRDVAIDERPIGYTGTGVGSPADDFFKPDTSRTALNKTLKSSSVSPFSSASSDKS
jgi:hypothetical protein